MTNWHEKGELPPFKEKVLWHPDSNQVWIECVVIADCGDNDYVMEFNGSKTIVRNPTNFRPIKHKADQERRKAIEEMIEVNRPDWELSKEVVGKLYDAGYRKVKPCTLKDIESCRSATLGMSAKEVFEWLLNRNHIVSEGG